MDFPEPVLFPELAPNNLLPVEVTVVVPEGGGRRCVMQVLASRGEADVVFAMAWEACAGYEDFEVTARPFRGERLA